ncbi:MAG TPA: PilZ domain-containing protein [Myxococcota bacterium]|nr:PilZ domain-containing protein [Myxococcota bacterium]
MAKDRCVLLLDGPSGRLAGLRDRLSGLGLSGVVAKDPAEAGRALAGRSPARVALLVPEFGAPALREALASLVEKAPERDLGFVATGPTPSAETRSRLRGAGVRLALWEPFDDGALRFQINRARHHKGNGRDEMRIPTTLLARIIAADRPRDAIIYNLSARGAFLETPRAQLRGALIEIEIPLPSGMVRVRARVRFHNVAGNLLRSNLPFGMGIEFTGVPRDATDAIRVYVEERSKAFEV